MLKTELISHGFGLDLAEVMNQFKPPADLRRNSAQKTPRGILHCSGCGCAPWVLLLIVAVLVYPFFQRGLLFPDTLVTQPICRQIRFFSSYAEVQDMPAMYFLVDRRTDSSWIAIQASDDQYLWSEFGSVVGVMQDTVAQLLQDGNLPILVQETVKGMVGMADSPRIPQIALLSPALQDCSPGDQTALEHIFARDVLGTQSTGRQREAATEASSTSTPTETGPDSGQVDVAQEQITASLGTVMAERGANIRSGPGLEHEIVTVVPHGHLVAYVAESDDGEWLQLEDGNWIFASLVTTSGKDESLDSTVLAEPGGRTPTSGPQLAAEPVLQPTTTPIAAAWDSTDEMAALRLQALNHVNHARALEGLSPVLLGDNAAAQSHADEMARNQYLSHWNLTGLTPDMRYTLAGGEAYSAENVAFIGNIVGPECIPYEPAEWLENALDGFMESPGHRRNILRPEHTTLHLGISFDCRILTMVQLFEGAYVTFDIPPTIAEGRLFMQGRLHNRAVLPRTGPAEGIRITYWPPPHPLTRGQLFRAGGYCPGIPIASILVPLPAFYTYDSGSFSWNHTGCLTPYQSDPQSLPPLTNSQAHELMQAAKQWEPNPKTYSRLEILPDIWQVELDSFTVQADVSRLLATLGSGVYTILLWGEVQGAPLPISEYAIFVE